jgi:hypothetical protein
LVPGLEEDYMADGKVDGNFVKSATLAERVAQRYREENIHVAAKFDFHSTCADVLRKVREFEDTSVRKILAKVNALVKPLGYTLDMNKTYIDLQRGGSEDRIEGMLHFTPIAGARTVVVDLDVLEKAMKDLFDIWVRPRRVGDDFQIGF